MNPTSMLKPVLILPVPKNPYCRYGPLNWQDYYRQLKRTIEIAHQLENLGNEVTIAVISAFHPNGRVSETDVYRRILLALAPELKVHTYKETNDTRGQVERSFELAAHNGATPIFISTWMHYLRVRYLCGRRPARHCGVFGIPHPAFAFIDMLCLVLHPIVDFFGVEEFFRRAAIHRRKQGKIL